jgi:predicted phosphodiesterase
MAPRPDGLEAVWSVSRLARGRLEWQSADGRAAGAAATDAFGFVPQGKQILRVRLDGLTPGGSYRVRAVTTATDDGASETSPWKEFRPLAPAAPRTSFVVWNDTHANSATLQQLHAATPAADFLVWNGDTCNDWKSEDLLAPTLLYPGQQDITAGRPLCLVWGNHDVRGKHAYVMPALVATPGGRPFYALRSGPVAAVFLHTGEDKPDAHPSFGGRVAFDRLRREQADWLAETIRRPELATAPYRVVFCHIPLRWTDEGPQDYARGGFDRHSGRSRAAWHAALVAWRTQLVISGHTHRPAWLPPTAEFPYGQLIGGGPTPTAATWMEAQADARRLHIAVRGLDGATRHEVTLAPLA